MWNLWEHEVAMQIKINTGFSYQSSCGEGGWERAWRRFGNEGAKVLVTPCSGLEALGVDTVHIRC